MRVFFTNLGCKLNQAEIDDLTRRFVAAGHSLAAGLDEAQLHVINSCTVTHLAARDSRKIARRGRRQNPGLRTVLTGCYATSEPDAAARLAGVDLVVSNRRKDRLLELVHEAFPDVVPAASLLPLPYVPIDLSRPRGLVKIEDGCNMRCSFCIIPSTRGRQVSRPLSQVVSDVQALAEAGYLEVVVTGVQISEYDDGGRRLYDLASALLAETDMPRLRLTSIAPWRFDPRLLGLWTDSRLCRHIHMSLQSGSTATLRRMRRPYTAESYAALADRLRSAIPDLALTTDVIVGFPGETAEEFAESLSFVERMAFARPHVFTYSRRDGTEAATLPAQVPPREKKARMAEMLAVARASDRAFRRRFVGRTVEILWEGCQSGRHRGLTDNYIRVFSTSPRPLTGTIGRVRLLQMAAGGMEGVPVDGTAPVPPARAAGSLLADLPAQP